MKKLNSFEMLPKECANEMYSRLNVLVEEVNGIGLTQMQPSDVVRKILSVLPIDKYGCLHQNLEEGSQKLESSRNHVSKGSITCGSKPADSDTTLELTFFR